MKLLTRAEAAERCRVSLAAFDAHVRPALTPKRVGRRVLFLESDLDAWAETESPSNAAPTKRGPSPAQPKTRTGAPASALRAALQSGPRAQEIRTKLMRKLQSSSRLRELASSEQPGEHGAKVLALPLRRSQSNG
jgi:hypothetical protein